MVVRKGSQLMAGAKVWKESRQGDSGWAASLQSPGLQVALLKKEPPSPHPPTKQARRVLAARALGRRQAQAGWPLAESRYTEGPTQGAKCPSVT